MKLRADPERCGRGPTCGSPLVSRLNATVVLCGLLCGDEPAHGADLSLRLSTRLILESVDELPVTDRPPDSLLAAAAVGQDLIFIGALHPSASGQSRYSVERHHALGDVRWVDVQESPDTLGRSLVVTSNGFVHSISAGKLYTYNPAGLRVPTAEPANGSAPITRLAASTGGLFLHLDQLGGGCADRVFRLSLDGSSIVNWTFKSPLPCPRFVTEDRLGGIISIQTGLPNDSPAFSVCSYQSEAGTNWRAFWEGALPVQSNGSGSPPEVVQTGNGSFILIGGIRPGQRTEMAKSFGKSDIWLGWLGADGHRLAEQTYGGLGEESALAVGEILYGHLVLVGRTIGSGVSGAKRTDGDGTWVLQLDAAGDVERDYVLPEGRHVATLFDGTSVRVVLSKTHSWVVHQFRALPQFVVVADAADNETFAVEVSTDLKTWSTRAQGVGGTIELRDIATDSARFFRAVTEVSNP